MDYPPEAIADIRARAVQAERDSIMAEVNALGSALGHSGNSNWNSIHKVGESSMKMRVLQLIATRSISAKAEIVRLPNPAAPYASVSEYAKHFPLCTCIGHEPRCADCKERIRNLQI